MIKRLLLSTLAACLAVMGAWADEPFRLHRFDSFQATPVTGQSIVFVGNSITNMQPWAELFATPGVVNRGNSGGFSWEILSNVQSFIAKRPAKLFIMIGTNDMNVAGYAPEKVVANVRQTVKHIQKESPATQVYVESVMASNNGSRTLDKGRELNRQLKAMAEEMGVTFVDYFDATINIANGGGMSYDNLHPHVLGSRAWTAALAPYVGADAVLPAEPVVNNAGQSNSYGSRASVFAQLPVTADDVLFIGDEFVHSGEWQELLGNPNVKNRGTGWGKWGPNIDFQTACVPLILKGLEGNQQPKQVLLMTASQQLTSSSANLDAIKTQYQACIDAIRQNAPATKLSLVSVIPYGTTATNINTRNLVPFNAWLKQTAEAMENAEFIDLYSVLTDNNTALPQYINADQYVTGLGYQACARELAKHIDGCNVLTEAEAEAYYNLVAARAALSHAIDAAELGGAEADLEPYYTLLAKDDATVDELKEAVASFQVSEYVIKVNKDSGTTYRNGAVTTSGWVSQWASAQTEPFRLSFGTSYNNMNASTLGIAVGTSSAAWTFTLSSQDYYVHSYTFDIKGGDNNQVITPADGQAVSLNTSTFITITWQNDEKGHKTASFTFTGANKEATIQNMIVVVRPVVEKPEPQCNVFEFGTPGNSICYRIPAIATAHNGDVISVADYRYGGADIGFGRVSLHARISADNGKTWGDKIVVAESHQGQYGVDKADDLEAGFGDPAIVADRESDNVLLLSCCGNVSYPAGTWAHHQGIARFRSADNGKTWSKYEDIAPGIYRQFKDAGVDVQAMFVGSGRIFQSRFVKLGQYYRLYCVVLLRTASQGGLNYVLYSDDFGGSWYILGDDATPGVTSGDEPKAEELPDGSVLLSSRVNGGRIFNIFQFTNMERGEGAWMQQAWSDANANKGTVAQQNACNGEIMLVPVVRAEDNKKMWLALQSVPYGPGRTNVSIYYKGLGAFADYSTPVAFASNWEGRLQTSNISSGYSTMTLQHDGTIGFLFEESTFGKDYTIVYKNYTIEAITGGAYTLDAEPVDPFVLTADGVEAKTVGLKFSEFVGGIKESSRGAIDDAVAAFKAEPSLARYLAINQAAAEAERVEFDPAVQYILRNVGRGTSGSLAMSVPATATLQLASSNYSKTSKRQQWTFVPTGEEGVWKVYNEFTNSFLMNTLAVEKDMYTTTDFEQAGTYRIQGKDDRLCLICTQPTNGTYPAVHLPANTARMVCWTAAGEASQWFFEPTEVPSVDFTPVALPQATSVEAPVYDLQGRLVGRPAQHGIYIQNRRKRAM